MLRSRCSITVMSVPMKQKCSAGGHSAPKVGFLDLLHARDSQKTKVFFELLHENPRKKNKWFLTSWLKCPDNKGFFGFLARSKWSFWPDDWPFPENKGLVFWITAWKSKKNKCFFWPGNWNSKTKVSFRFTARNSQKNNGAPNPRTHRISQCSPKSWNQPHHQRYFQGTPFHEPKPSEGGPSHSSVRKVTILGALPVTGCWLWSHNKQKKSNWELIPPKQAETSQREILTNSVCLNFSYNGIHYINV